MSNTIEIPVTCTGIRVLIEKDDFGDINISEEDLECVVTDVRDYISSFNTAPEARYIVGLKEEIKKLTKKLQVYKQYHFANSIPFVKAADMISNVVSGEFTSDDLIERLEQFSMMPGSPANRQSNWYRAVLCYQDTDEPERIYELTTDGLDALFNKLIENGDIKLMSSKSTP
jgi:sulfur relay (sulfurtransferase) DsrC/TusE family protein